MLAITAVSKNCLKLVKFSISVLTKERVLSTQTIGTCKSFELKITKETPIWFSLIAFKIKLVLLLAKKGFIYAKVSCGPSHVWGGPRAKV